MKNTVEKIKKVTAKMATAMVDGDAREWPPVCVLFAYQPLHPNAAAKEAPNHSEGEEKTLA